MKTSPENRPLNRMTFLPVIPTKWYSVSHIFWQSTIYIYIHILTFSLICILTFYLTVCLPFYLTHSLTFDLTLSAILSDMYSMYSDTLPVTVSPSDSNFFRNLQTLTQVPEKNTGQLLLICKCKKKKHFCCLKPPQENSLQWFWAVVKAIETLESPWSAVVQLVGL